MSQKPQTYSSKSSRHKSPSLSQKDTPWYPSPQQFCQKQHQWTDEQLYPQPQPDQSTTCWQSFKIGANNFMNRTIDYFQFDRLFTTIDAPSQCQLPKIDLKRCNKRYLEDYDQTYSDREIKFGYTFQEVLEEKIKQEKRKEKDFWTQLYKFICCQGANEMVELDQAYKSERQFERLLKQKVMERRKEYEEERKIEEEKMVREREERKEEENKEALKLENIQVQDLEENVLDFYEEGEKVEQEVKVTRLKGRQVKVRKDRDSQSVNIFNQNRQSQSPQTIKTKINNRDIQHYNQIHHYNQVHHYTQSQHYTQQQHITNLPPAPIPSTNHKPPIPPITKQQPQQPQYQYPRTNSNNQVSIPKRTSSQTKIKQDKKQVEPQEEGERQIISNSSYPLKNKQEITEQEGKNWNQERNAAQKEHYQKKNRKRRNFDDEQPQYIDSYKHTQQRQPTSIQLQQQPQQPQVQTQRPQHQHPQVQSKDIPVGYHQQLPHSPKITFEQPQQDIDSSPTYLHQPSVVKQRRKKRKITQQSQLLQSIPTHHPPNPSTTNQQHIQQLGQAVASKKRRKPKRQLHSTLPLPQQQLIPNSNTLQHQHPQSSLTTQPYSSTIQPTSEIMFSKKKRPRKQIKVQQNQELVQDIVINAAELVQSCAGDTYGEVKAEKKRKRGKVRQEIQEEKEEEVIQIDL